MESKSGKRRLRTARTYRACLSSALWWDLVALHHSVPEGEERQVEESRGRLHDRLRKPDLRTCLDLEARSGMEEVRIFRLRRFPGRP